MFSLQVVDTDKFIEMSVSARLLYYELGMRADDDGFVASPKKIIRSVGCSEDDIKLLITKGFVIPFESGIVVIRHWKMNNYLQADRYKKTIYQEEMKSLSLTDGVYNTDTSCIQNVSIGKDRVGKVREGKTTTDTSASADGLCVDYSSIQALFNSICIDLPKVRDMTSTRRKRLEKAEKQLGDISFESFFQRVQASNFLTGRGTGNWKASFDWILKPENLTKILEGNYDNRQEQTNSVVYQEGW